MEAIELLLYIVVSGDPKSKSIVISRLVLNIMLFALLLAGGIIAISHINFSWQWAALVVIFLFAGFFLYRACVDIRKLRNWPQTQNTKASEKQVVG